MKKLCDKKIPRHGGFLRILLPNFVGDFFN